MALRRRNNIICREGETDGAHTAQHHDCLPFCVTLTHIYGESYTALTFKIEVKFRQQAEANVLYNTSENALRQ